MLFTFFFFNDTATTEIYTLSLHDALPISSTHRCPGIRARAAWAPTRTPTWCGSAPPRSEEHTSELQSRLHLVCRLLLEKKKRTLLTTTSIAFRILCPSLGPTDSAAMTPAL